MKKYNPKIHHRRSIRLKGYDYSTAGFYFVTICVKNRACLFGDIVNGKMILNEAGKMTKSEWLNLKTRFKNIELHEFIIMPDHFHAIIEIVGSTLVVDPNDFVPNDSHPNDSHPNDFDPNNPKNPDRNNSNTPNKPNVATQTQIGYITDMGQPQGVVPTVITNSEHDNPTEKNHSSIEKKENNSTPKTLGDILGAFQSIVTVNYIRGVKTFGWKPFDVKLWQRNYYEHIIRSDRAFHNISEYIKNNPKKWESDRQNKKVRS